LWFFRSPEIIFGEDSLAYISTLPIRKAAIVVDKNLIRSEQLSKVMKSLPPNCEALPIGEIPEEPRFSDISNSMMLINNFAPDWFIALGGGSTIDAAKVLFFSYERPDLSYYDMTPLEPLNLRKKSRLLAIPTTSGTGSDCSWAAVVTGESDHRKIELASPEILPDVSILDPQMVMTLPLEQTRSTAVDALTHATEAYVATWNNLFSDALAEKSFELITNNLPFVISSPSSIEHRNIVHVAASMAGLSFSNSQIGLSHALGHALGARFRIAHGKAVGLFLPRVVSFNYESCKNRYDRLNRLMPDKYRKNNLTDSLFSFFRDIGQPVSIRELGLDLNEYKSKIDDLVALAAESTGVTMNSRDSNTEQLKDFFVQVIGER
jgi:alcohol dehydrogenase class IV